MTDLNGESFLLTADTIRSELEALKLEHAALVDRARSNSEDFRPDQFMLDMTGASACLETLEQSKDFTRRRKARDLERSEVALRKLKNHFFGGIVTEEFTVHGIVTAVSVSSIRTTSTVVLTEDPVAVAPPQPMEPLRRSRMSRTATFQVTSPTGDEVRKGAEGRLQRREETRKKLAALAAHPPAGEDPFDTLSIEKIKQGMLGLAFRGEDGWVAPAVSAQEKFREIKNLEFSCFELAEKFNAQVRKIRENRQTITKLWASALTEGNTEMDSFKIALTSIPGFSGDSVPELIDFLADRFRNEETSKSPDDVLVKLPVSVSKPVPIEVKEFDKCVSDLARQRLSISASLKVAELRLITLGEEFSSLLTSEEADKQLRLKVSEIQEQLDNVTEGIADCGESLSEKRCEVTEWQRKEGELIARVRLVLKGGEDDQNYVSQVFAIYRKSQSKKKKRDLKKNDSDDDISSSSDSEGKVVDVCPSGCPKEVFNEVLSLRNERYALDSELEALQISIESISKQHGNLSNKESFLQNQLKTSKINLENLQVERQRALNKIRVLLPMKVSNILQASNLPISLSESSIFIYDQILKFKIKIDEIKNQTDEAKHSFADLKGSLDEKIQSRENSKKNLIALQGQLREMMRLQFGSEVDLDFLDKLSVQIVEKQNSDKPKFVSSVNPEDIIKARRALKEATDRNTAIISALTEAGKNKLKDERTVAPTEPSPEEEASRNQQIAELRKKIQLKNNQIQKLKNEINTISGNSEVNSF